MKSISIFLSTTILGTLILVVIATFFGIDIARIQLSQPKTITVSGIAKQDEINQLARFNATVSTTGDSKESVSIEMEEKVNALTLAAIDFGIEEKFIKTQYFNIYQEEITDYEANVPTVKKGPWRGNTSISFEQVASELADSFSQLLVRSGATSIDGPSFSLDDYESVQNDLANQALENARQKASDLAASQGMSLGEIVAISEADTGLATPFMKYGGLGGGAAEAAFMPGTSEVAKTMVVTFELK